MKQHSHKVYLWDGVVIVKVTNSSGTPVIYKKFEPSLLASLLCKKDSPETYEKLFDKATTWGNKMVRVLNEEIKV